MSNEYSIEISLQEIGMAYRRTKVDMFYTSLPVKEKILDYEQNLSQNLFFLYQQLTEGNIDWFRSEEFLGSWTLDPKKITPNIKYDVIFSIPKNNWDYSLKNSNKIDIAFIEHIYVEKLMYFFH